MNLNDIKKGGEMTHKIIDYALRIAETAFHPLGCPRRSHTLQHYVSLNTSPNVIK